MRPPLAAANSTGRWGRGCIKVAKGDASGRSLLHLKKGVGLPSMETRRTEEETHRISCIRLPPARLSAIVCLTPKICASCKIFSRSGMDCAPSHLETDCRVTFQFFRKLLLRPAAFFEAGRPYPAKIISLHLTVLLPGPGSLRCFQHTLPAVTRHQPAPGNVSTGGCTGRRTRGKTAFSVAFARRGGHPGEHAQQAEEQQRLCCGSRGPDAVHAQHRRQKEQKQGLAPSGSPKIKNRLRRVARWRKKHGGVRRNSRPKRGQRERRQTTGRERFPRAVSDEAPNSSGSCSRAKECACAQHRGHRQQ